MEDDKFAGDIMIMKNKTISSYLFDYVQKILNFTIETLMSG